MKLAPKFTVVPLNDKRKFVGTVYSVEYQYEDIITDDGREIRRKVENSGHLVSKNVETTGGFLVKFPNGNSIRVETKEQLEAMGFTVGSTLVDLDSGEEVPVNADGSVDFRAMVHSVAVSPKQVDDQMDLFGDTAREEVEAD